MSASPMARQVTDSQVIPTKRVLINDPSELPSHYSSTPGGTLYSTTPGGTKIVYEKAFMMNLRNSPISKTPPRFEIPETLQKGNKANCFNGTSPGKTNGFGGRPQRSIKNNIPTPPRNPKKVEVGHEDQFHMDI